MMAIVSLVFRVLIFPHQGKVVTIYKLYYYIPNSRANIGMNIPFTYDSKTSFDNIDVGILKYSFLMGTFTLPPLVGYVNLSPICMILSSIIESQGFSLMPISIEYIVLQHLISSHTLVVNQDPWAMPYLLDIEFLGSSMLLSVIEISQSDYTINLHGR
jgi:hypothetical protein